MDRIGIDVGGTFTDFAVSRDGEPPRYFKTPSTPSDPTIGVLTGLREVAGSYGIALEELLGSTELVLHGTTVATNALVERKGARVGLLTTEGFRDLLEMREGLKEDRYNLRMTPVEPLVPRYLRFGVPERTRWDGSVATPVDEAALVQILEQLAEKKVDALAVCYLFSFQNPEHELRTEQAIKKRFPGIYTSLSHQILPQIKEYDRLSTTVVNSYVGPVLGEYLVRLKEALASLRQDMEILVMQSNGGVAAIDDSVQQAVRGVLSGPAGGVTGAGFYGGLIGESKVIGFDMGGTSTDISLTEDGEPHLTSERFEAGWKLAVPMIDVQTLGAGGGSVARVDAGGILQVGPDSAGADPGPVCYGKGGQSATVTDANLVLGYLNPDNFLGGKATLDCDAAEKAIEQQVATPLSLSTVEAAHGVHQVVSTTIAEGIRLMAVKRGVDHRDFAMLAFGGAAGLQASRVARQLKIEKVIVPPAAAVLSAYGMLATDLQYDYSQTYTASLDGIDLAPVRTIIGEMENRGREKLRTQGLSDDQIAVQWMADMRYLDQVYEVTVPLPDLFDDEDALLSQWTSNFHQRYEELFSYHQVDQEIRLVTLRVTVFGRLPRVRLPERDQSLLPSGAFKSERRIYLGEWRDVPVYDMDRLPAGAEIHGPAMLESDLTTVLVEQWDMAKVDRFGGIEIAVTQEVGDLEAAGPGHSERPDPVTLAVVGHRLESIALEMSEVMIRTAMSQILNSTRDFSTAILDADCQLVAQGEGLPVHISALAPAGAAVRDYFGVEIADGDLYALNDPYFGGSHLPDITVIKPVFKDSRLLFYAVNRAHHSDVGGATHGGYNASATEIYQEGIRIPPLKIYDRGVPRHDLLQMLSANVRHPENFLGDLNAQIGSVSIAAQRISSLVESYGPDRLVEHVSEVLSATERQVRQFISEWPDGVYRGESLIDDDGFDSKMIPIRATVTIDGDTMTIDLSESSPPVTGFLNSAYANTRSLAHVASMYMAPADVPKNEGSMRPVRVIAPKGTIVNASPPSPVAMSTNHCAEEIIEAIFKALAPAVPHTVNAGFSRRFRFAITGTDPRTGRQYIWHFFRARGGGGASQGHDGWSNVGEIHCPGGIRSASIEVTEERFPLFVKVDEFRPDSAGDGTWRGGLGAYCEMVYEGTENAWLNTAGDGVKVPPYGLFGGGSGLPHLYKIVSGDSERVLLTKETGVLLRPGDVIVCLSSGGGGFGDPKDRPQERRQWDRLNGYCL